MSPLLILTGQVIPLVLSSETVSEWAWYVPYDMLPLPAFCVADVYASNSPSVVSRAKNLSNGMLTSAYTLSSSSSSSSHAVKPSESAESIANTPPQYKSDFFIVNSFAVSVSLC